MKKISLLIALSFIYLTTNAQTSNDTLRVKSSTNVEIINKVEIANTNGKIVIGQINKNDEEVEPLFNVNIYRKCKVLDLDNKTFENVILDIKSTSIDKVYITIKDSNGILVDKIKLKRSYLYIFRDGQIQIGLKNYNKVIIKKIDDPSNWNWIGIIREREGVY